MDDKIEAWANDIIREVAELPDRNSPEGQPEMMLVSADELRSIIVRTTPEGFVLVPIEWTDEQQTSAQEMLNVLRGALGENLSDETMIGAIYDGMTAPFRKLAASQESWT